jgi:hypothetical protein
VFFQFTHEGKKYKFKIREGINRIKEIVDRIEEIEKMRGLIELYLMQGWNPILDREVIGEYNPYSTPKPEAITL